MLLRIRRSIVFVSRCFTHHISCLPCPRARCDADKVVGTVRASAAAAAGVAAPSASAAAAAAAASAGATPKSAPATVTAIAVSNPHAGLDVRIEVMPKRTKRVTPAASAALALAPPPSLLQRAVSEDALDLLDRLLTSERQETDAKRRFDAVAAGAVPAAADAGGMFVDPATRLSTRLLATMKLQSATKLLAASAAAAVVPGAAGAAGAAGVGGGGYSDKDEKQANPTLAVTREQLYDLIRTVQSEQRAVRDAQLHALRAHTAAALNEVVVEEETRREAEVVRLRRERNAQDERFTELALKLEAKNYARVAAIVREGRDKLSEVRVAEMTKREAELVAAQRVARKQAEEFSELRLQLEKQNEAKLKELAAKQESLRQNIEGKFMPGEEDVANAHGSGLKSSIVYCINARTIRSHFGQTGEYHFRYAESQFLRLTAGQPFVVTRVDYIVNAPLVQAFRDCAAQLKRRNKTSSPTILGFHGTSASSIDGIIRTNFSLAKLASATGDNGWYGAGVYFSEMTSVSMGYNKTQSSMLLSKVLIGRQYNCPGRMDGAPLMSGYDSHLSPDRTEVVIFNADQILPCYIVHYQRSNTTSALAAADGRDPGDDGCHAVTDLRKYHVEDAPHNAANAPLGANSYAFFSASKASAIATAAATKFAYANDLAELNKAKLKTKPWAKPTGKPKRGGKRKH